MKIITASEPAKIQNASRAPQVYYGLHMCQGVAEYKDPSFTGRLLILDDVLKQMNPSAQGIPMYVRHVDDVDFSIMEKEASGYVLESFYNPLDGMHWCKFIIVSDAGHQAIANGWTLSNCYKPSGYAPGGEWQGVQFEKQVMGGTYEHIAQVPNPRYAQSKVLTPEAFKAYNAEKESELATLANSKETPDMALRDYFKTKKAEKVENSAEIEGLSVTLKSGITKTIAQICNDSEELEDVKKKNEEEKGKPQMANGDHEVEVGKDKMTVNDLVKRYQGLTEKREATAEEKAAAEKKNAEDEAAKKAEEEKANEKVEEDKKANAKAEADKLANAATLKTGDDHFDSVMNAKAPNVESSEPVYESKAAKLQRGKDKY